MYADVGRTPTRLRLQLQCSSRPCPGHLFLPLLNVGFSDLSISPQVTSFKIGIGQWSSRNVYSLSLSTHARSDRRSGLPRFSRPTDSLVPIPVSRYVKRFEGSLAEAEPHFVEKTLAQVGVRRSIFNSSTHSFRGR